MACRLTITRLLNPLNILLNALICRQICHWISGVSNSLSVYGKTESSPPPKRQGSLAARLYQAPFFFLSGSFALMSSRLARRLRMAMYITKDTSAAAKQRTKIVPALIDFSHHFRVSPLNCDEMGQLTRLPGAKAIDMPLR
jgi:hypothetical protein